MHPLEVQAIADGEVAIGMQGRDPIADRRADPGGDRSLQRRPERRGCGTPRSNIPMPEARPKGARYTPVSKRQDRPDAIAWLLKNYPELSDAQVCKLIGTTKPTIDKVRERTHWNSANIKPRNPVSLGICSERELEKEVDLARARSGIVHGA